MATNKKPDRSPSRLTQPARSARNKANRALRRIRRLKEQPKQPPGARNANRRIRFDNPNPVVVAAPEPIATEHIHYGTNVFKSGEEDSHGS